MKEKLVVSYRELQKAGCGLNPGLNNLGSPVPQTVLFNGKVEVLSEDADAFAVTSHHKRYRYLIAFLTSNRVPYSREVTYPTPPGAKSKITSIQVAATLHTTAEPGTAYAVDDIEVVSDDTPEKSHYSVYVRDESGMAEHVQDFEIVGVTGGVAMARLQALAFGATLSMAHGVPIEAMG